jgi:hypothetical protein
MPTTDFTVPGQYPITVESYKRHMVVCYGEARFKVESYDAAIKEIGAAIMHALTCDGRVPENFLPKD